MGCCNYLVNVIYQYFEYLEMNVIATKKIKDKQLENDSLIIFEVTSNNQLENIMEKRCPSKLQQITTSPRTNILSTYNVPSTV